MTGFWDNAKLDEDTDETNVRKAISIKTKKENLVRQPLDESRRDSNPLSSKIGPKPWEDVIGLLVNQAMLTFHGSPSYLVANARTRTHYAYLPLLLLD